MKPKETSPKRSNGTAATKAKARKAPSKAATRPAKPALDPPQVVLEPSDDEIALKAYLLWESRGRPHGSPDEDWHRAKQELNAR